MDSILVGQADIRIKCHICTFIRWIRSLFSFELYFCSLL